jgi:hypothetical protein
VSTTGVVTNTYYFNGNKDDRGSAETMTLGRDGYLYGYGANSIFRYDITTAPPPDVSIGVNPSTITAGKDTMLFWNVTSGTGCAASGDWSGSQALSGSASVAPTTLGPSTFTLTCTGSGGDATVSAIINVNPAPTLSMSFAAATVPAGTMATLSWNGSNASNCTASGAWAGAQPSSGTEEVAPNSPGNYTYNLSCLGFAGDSTVTASATLMVTASANGSSGGKGGGGGIGLEEIAALGLLGGLGKMRRKMAGLI